MRPPLETLTREFWRSSQTLRGRNIAVGCEHTTAFRCLVSLARHCENCRLRRAAIATLARLGYAGVEDLDPPSDVEPMA